MVMTMSRMELKKSRKNRKNRSRIKITFFVFIIVMLFVGLLTTDYVHRTMLALNDEKRVIGYIWCGHSHTIQIMGNQIVVEQETIASIINDCILWLLEARDSCFSMLTYLL